MSVIRRLETHPPTYTQIGLPGVKAVSGLATQPITGTIFASTGYGDGGKLYTLDPATGQLTLVGDPAAALAIPGLTFDPATGVLYAVVALTNGGERSLGTLDPTDGTLSLIDPITLGGQPTIGVHAPLFERGRLRFSTGSAYSGGAGIGELDPTTGEVLSFQTFPGVTTTIAGLTITADDRVLGSTGAGEGKLYEFDLASGTATLIVDLATVRAGRVGPRQRRRCRQRRRRTWGGQLPQRPPATQSARAASAAIERSPGASTWNDASVRGSISVSYPSWIFGRV